MLAPPYTAHLSCAAKSISRRRVCVRLVWAGECVLAHKRQVWPANIFIAGIFYGRRTHVSMQIPHISILSCSLPSCGARGQNFKQREHSAAPCPPRQRLERKQLLYFTNVQSSPLLLYAQSKLWPIIFNWGFSCRAIWATREGNWVLKHQIFTCNQPGYNFLTYI